MLNRLQQAYNAYKDRRRYVTKLTRQQLKYKSLQQDLLKHKLAALSYKEDISKLQSENLKFKEQLSKFKQMNFWKRLVYLFKGYSL